MNLLYYFTIKEVRMHELNASEEVILKEVAGLVQRMKMFLEPIIESSGLDAKVDRSPIEVWAAELRFSSRILQDTGEKPSRQWNHHDRCIVVARVRQEMQMMGPFVLAFRVKDWIVRLEMASGTHLSAERLEAQRHKLLHTTVVH
jgi:hypothetical protein